MTRKVLGIGELQMAVRRESKFGGGGGGGGERREGG